MKGRSALAQKVLAGVAITILAGMALPGPILAASPDCGSFPELKVFDGNNETTLIGLACPQFTDNGFDANYGVNAPITGANDRQNSFKFWNPTSDVWCVVFHEDANFSGSYVFYSLGHSDTYWVPSGGTMPSGWNNRISSVEFAVRVGSACDPY